MKRLRPATIGLVCSLGVGAIGACGAFSSHDDEPVASTTPDGILFPDGSSRDPLGVDGAVPGEVPDGLPLPIDDGGVPSDAGPCKSVFVTATGKGGDLNLLTGADALCKSASGGAAKYVAWLGTGDMSAIGRLAPKNGVRWCQPGDGETTATADSLRAKTLLKGITRTATGAPIGKDNAHVWVGKAFDDSSVVADCNNWNSDSQTGAYAIVGESGANLAPTTTESCGALNLLYCFEK